MWFFSTARVLKTTVAGSMDRTSNAKVKTAFGLGSVIFSLAVVCLMGFLGCLVVACYLGSPKSHVPDMFFTYQQQIHTRDLFNQAVADEEVVHGPFRSAPQLILWPGTAKCQADCVYVNQELAACDDARITHALVVQLLGIRQAQMHNPDPHPMATSVPDPQVEVQLVDSPDIDGEGYSR